MHPAELVYGFLKDLWHLPFLFQLVILWIVATWAWQWRKESRRTKLEKDAASWPRHQARVVWAQVSDEKKEGRHGGTYWEGLLTYSYALPGQEIEVGEYRRKFYDEETADAWARGLKDTFVNVRVDPADSKRSAWLEDVQAVSVLPPPGPGHLGDPAGVRRTIAACALFAISGVGAAIAFLIHLSCLLGKPLVTDANIGVFFGMHCGAIVCAIGSQVLAPGSWKRYRYWKNVSDAKTSTLMRWLGGYCGIVFIYAWIRFAANIRNPEPWSALMFSAVWLAFYAYSAELCWLVLRRAPEGNAII